MWHWLCIVPMIVLAIIVGISKLRPNDTSVSPQSATPVVNASTNAAPSSTPTLANAQSNAATEIPSQGRQHIAPNATHPAYNSTPATSGWHYAGEAQWKAYDEPVPYELQVHNLEHGGVIIHYHPDRITSKEVLDALYLSLKKEYKKVILVPDTQLSTAYVLTSWTWIDSFDVYDEGRIRAFVTEHYNDAPESSVE